MNTCRKVNQQFSCYLEGDLDAPKQAEVEAHLQECVSCRAELERFQRLLGLLEELPPPASAGWSLDEFRAARAACQRRKQRRPDSGRAGAD